MADTLNGHKRNDIEYGGKPASIRYKNPGAAYPDKYSKMFGATEYGLIGGDHPIAKFDTFEQGIAANIYKFFHSKNYVNKTFKEAFTTWSDNPSNASKYYQGVKGITDTTVVDPSMIRDKELVSSLWSQVLKIETGDEQGYPQIQSAFEQGYKLAMDKVEGNPLEFPEKPSDESSEEQYPVLSEKSEAVKEVVAGEFVNLAANVFPDRTIAAITNSLPANIASLPSASKISREILESIQSGEGVQSFTSAVEKIASAETPVSRLQAIGDIATEYEADIKALYPDLGSIDFKSAVEGIVNIAGEESPSQRLVSGLRMMETMDPDKLMTVGDVLKESAPIIERNFDVENFKDQPLSTLFDVNKLSEQGKAAFAPYKNIPISTFEANPESPIAKLGLLGKALYGTKEEQAKALEYLTKGQLPDIPGLEESFPTLLSGSLEDIVQTPIVTEKLGKLPERILTSERPREIETALTGFAGDIISKETKGAIDRNTSQTLLAGGTEEEVKQMRQTIGGMALDNFVESNPTLKSIIQWFTENKELVALLGTAGAFAGLTSLLGGGQLKGFATGLAGITGVRMMLGEEGFNEFSGMMQKAASPVFDMASGLLEETGLSEVPLVGSFLKGALDLGRENPLAGIAAAGGNFGAAAGILAGTNFDELGGKASQIIETLSSEVRKDTQVQQDIAAVGSTHLQDQMVRPTDRSGDTAKKPGNPGISSQAGMFHMLAYPNYQDFGRTGMGSAAGS